MAQSNDVVLYPWAAYARSFNSSEAKGEYLGTRRHYMRERKEVWVGIYKRDQTIYDKGQGISRRPRTASSTLLIPTTRTWTVCPSPKQRLLINLLTARLTLHHLTYQPPPHHTTSWKRMRSKKFCAELPSSHVGQNACKGDDYVEYSHEK